MGFIVRKAQLEPDWHAVMGGRIKFAPINRALVRRARRVALKALDRDEHGPEPQGDAADIAVQIEDLGDALGHAIIMEGALDWDGALEEVDGEYRAIEFSREALADMLADPVYYDAADAAYVMPYVMREREKNVSAVSPSGIGEAVTQGSDTVSTAVKPKRPAGAKRARTGSTRSKPRTAKARGKS